MAATRQETEKHGAYLEWTVLKSDMPGVNVATTTIEVCDLGKVT